MTRRGVLSELVERALALGQPAKQQPAETLLTDLLACIIGANIGNSPRHWAKDGTSGLATALAMRAHARDQDDFHWASGVHPGSVVWPVALAIGTEVGASGAEVLVAARAGYEAMTSLASVLGKAHARSWHATATCGAFGAAIPAAMLLGLVAEEVHTASAHAVAMSGGVGQAVLEHSGTTMFHRMAATCIGIQAARLAQTGIPASGDPLEGERGVLPLLAPQAGLPNVPAAASDALGTASVRLFPVNGFAQSAVALTAQLRQEVGPDVDELTVEVATAVADATTGAVGGDWWDLKTAVAAAWTGGDPFALESSEASRSLRARIWVVPRPGSAMTTTRITAHTSTGAIEAELVTAPGTHLDDPSLEPLLERKWELLIGAARGGAAFARSLARAVLCRGPRDVDLRELLVASDR